MLTILLATCEVTLDSDIEISRETKDDLERLIQRTRVELNAVGDGTTALNVLPPPPRGSPA